VAFLLTGKFIRTSSIERHRGDRPIAEYKRLVLESGFRILHTKGIFPTLPLISLLTLISPSAALPLHRVENALLAYPNWCFLDILELEPV
jgi:hypothetical protein